MYCKVFNRVRQKIIYFNLIFNHVKFKKVARHSKGGVGSDYALDGSLVRKL